MIRASQDAAQDELKAPRRAHDVAAQGRQGGDPHVVPHVSPTVQDQRPIITRLHPNKEFVLIHLGIKVTRASEIVETQSGHFVQQPGE
jgi:hypothetical protein